MPTATQDLREQRANIWDQMQKCIGPSQVENRAMTGEERETYDRLEKEFDTLADTVELQERHAAHAKSVANVDRTGVVPRDVAGGGELDSDTEAQFERIFNSFLKHGINELESDEKAIMRSRFTQTDKGILNAAGVGSGAAGGYAVPPQFRDTIVETMKWYGPMLELAETYQTDSGADVSWPTNDDTANVGAILAENTQMTEQDVTLGTATLSAYMYTSKAVRASFQILNDRPDFDTWLARKLGQRLGRILNQHLTTGTGTAQPLGIVTGATTGVTGTGSLATTGGFSYANLVDLVESLDPAYGNAAGGTGNAPGMVFMMHQSVRRALRKLVDTTGAPLWSPSIREGTPDLLLGYPTRINNDMATVAQSSKSLLFGNIREAYVARIVNDVTTVRLTERWADFLQVGFFAFERAGGTVQDANAVRVMQTTATA